MIDIICALCEKKQRTEILYPAIFNSKKISYNIYSARRLPDKIHYRLLRCKNCGLIFSSPIFSIDQIEKLYKKSSCNYDEQIPYLTKTYIKLFQTIKKLLPENPKILEIGCDNGFFIKALYEQGIHEVYGVEPSKIIVSKASSKIKSKIKVEMFNKKLYPKNSFDLVCCFHTLDHIVNINEFINEIYIVLKKNGIALIIVHDTQGLSVKIFGKASPIFDIEHIYLFNKSNLEKLFLKHKFIKTNVIDLRNIYPMHYWLRMSHLHNNVKAKIIKIINYIGIGKINLGLKAGNIAIVAIKK